MVTSGYATLAGFLAIVELVAAVWAMFVGARSLLPANADHDDAVERLEARTYLAGLLAYLLLGASLLSWLVFYFMLDSFVPQWKGAMCVYGVTQIGAGSYGIHRWLPRLVLLEQTLKPLLIFTTGAALVAYRYYRRQGTRTLLPQVALLLLLTAALAALDATAELAYVAIPKRESLPNSGCCSAAALAHEPSARANPHEPRQWTTAFYASQTLMVLLVLGASAAGKATFLRRGWLLLLPAGMTLAIALEFFAHVASPALLHLPYHHCIYDLVARVPESAVALLLFFAATCCVGWSAVVSGLARREASAEPSGEARRLLAWSLLGYVGSTAMISFNLWLA